MRTFEAANGCDSIVFLVLETLEEQSNQAKNDTFLLNSAIRIHELAILNNDLFPNSEESEIRIISEPLFGTAMLSNEGKIRYEITQDFFGLDSLTYQLCTTSCEQVCVTATVFLDIRPDCIQSLTADLPNAFIPNGTPPDDRFDPLADVLVACGGQISETSLTITNSWGEIVHEARPYTAWEGMNRNGKALPSGVYYYSLRFKVDKMQEIKGWVMLFREN